MRIRALLFIPVLAAAALAIGASGASAATLFTTTGHTARVAAGSLADATSVTPIDLTSSGMLADRCTHSSLGLSVSGNTATSPAVLTVTSSTFAPGCVGAGQPVGTHNPVWRLTVLGTGTMIGTQTAWNASVDNLVFDLPAPFGQFSGNLTTGVTVTQPTVATSPLCVDLNNAGEAFGLVAGTIDGRYCLTGTAAGWSLGDN